MYLVLCWNAFLSYAAIVNIGLWYRCTPALIEKTHASGFWPHVWASRGLLTLIFVVQCAIRSFNPRVDGDRTCMWDGVPLSSVMTGRSLAFIGELSFCAVTLSCLLMKGVITARLANTLLTMNLIAQSACWYSVITRDDYGHVVEESIWAFTGMILCYFVAIDGSVMRTTYGRSFLLFGSCYIIFMFLIDIPMYYIRAINDTEYQTLTEGFNDIQRCRKPTLDWNYWKDEMLWMTGYFTVAVWLMIAGNQKLLIA